VSPTVLVAFRDSILVYPCFPSRFAKAWHS
jgi:hypothetical protein